MYQRRLYYVQCHEEKFRNAEEKKKERKTLQSASVKQMRVFGDN